jgi:hypothetical protein
MKRTPTLLLCILLCSVGGRGARADDTPDVTLRQALEVKLLQPLAQRQAQRSTFSRARMPPAERRVRVIDAALTRDAQGQGYATFAVDVRFATARWAENAIVGCIYPDSGAVYVKYGDGWRDAAVLLGKKVADPAASVCQSADPSPSALTAGKAASGQRLSRR